MECNDRYGRSFFRIFLLLFCIQTFLISYSKFWRFSPSYSFLSYFSYRLFYITNLCSFTKYIPLFLSPQPHFLVFFFLIVLRYKPSLFHKLHQSLTIFNFAVCQCAVLTRRPLSPSFFRFFLIPRPSFSFSPTPHHLQPIHFSPRLPFPFPQGSSNLHPHSQSVNENLKCVCTLSSH